jgi:hypothetical protein
MEGYITEIENFLEITNRDTPIVQIIEQTLIFPPEETNKQMDVDKTTLDMKILKNRMDSVSIIKYYKDLKNNRIKTNENISYVDTEKDINDIMNKTNHEKPWGRSDTYTKKKKIDVFILKYLELHKNEDIDIIKNELYELLENKKISKKNIEFDTDNNITKLSHYSLF